MKNIYISILTFNDNPSTLNLLESIGGLNKAGFNLSVVVVDNASELPFSLETKAEGINYKVIRNDSNLGFSGGQNVGIKYALENNADFVIVLNNDTKLDKDLIINMLNSFTENVGVVVPKIYFAKGHEYHRDRYKNDELGKVIWYAGAYIDWNNVIGTHRGVDEVDSGQYDTEEETEVATGCCMMISSKALSAAGVFDEKFFLYYEDGDLSMRIKKAGFKIIYSPKSILWHINAAATGGSGSSLQDYYISRNRMLFGLRYASSRVKAALIKESIKILISGREWQKKGIRDFYMQRFGRGSFVKK
jgi:GT2 family glycosyltransferase